MILRWGGSAAQCLCSKSSDSDRIPRPMSLLALFNRRETGAQPLGDFVMLSTPRLPAPFNRAETMRRRCSTGFQPVPVIGSPYRPHFKCFPGTSPPAAGAPFNRPESRAQPPNCAVILSPLYDAAPHSPTTSARIPSPRRRRRIPLMCFLSSPSCDAAPHHPHLSSRADAPGQPSPVCESAPAAATPRMLQRGILHPYACHLSTPHCPPLSS